VQKILHINKNIAQEINHGSKNQFKKQEARIINKRQLAKSQMRTNAVLPLCSGLAGGL
jgi:hypothetical protein